MKKLLGLLLACLLAGCATAPAPTSAPAASAAPIAADLIANCSRLLGRTIPASEIGIPSGAARITGAVPEEASRLAVADRASSPAAAVRPALPRHCKVEGRISPLNAQAPDILFQVNLPLQWNGRSVQYGGGGFNGTIVSGELLLPAQPFDQPPPLAQGYVTYGTDSGHQHVILRSPPQAFALNDEALVNFAHASYKKVRDVAVSIMKTVYGRAPEKMYFVGSSEGGREGLAMAQRYPADFDGIFSRVPVIEWTGLQHAGLRDGLALLNGGWMNHEHVQLVHDAVLAACDAADGAADSIVSDPVGCRSRFDVTKLRCAGKAAANCLTDAQIRAVQTLHARLDLGVELANGLRSYPGRGPSGEATHAGGSAGGWEAWWTGSRSPDIPPVPANGIAWSFGAGAIQYFYARDPHADVRSYKAADHAARVRAVSALMDATNPDLSAFQAHGGKLILLENLGDYAQSPSAGIAYRDAVVQRLGRATADRFYKLYTAPNVDHVGTGAPGNADLFPALVAWVEQGRAPAGLVLVEQDVRPPFKVTRSRPLCEWPQFPHYRGGDMDKAGSFACAQ
jgi:feruloyl esterase